MTGVANHETEIVGSGKSDSGDNIVDNGQIDRMLT